ncbi:pentapeptide repeat-containing protein [Candidatus Babeliales bacterium]|nr:pentapeptide repeat-containing protein [Candidatus Babeliales bacterium]
MKRLLIAMSIMGLAYADMEDYKNMSFAGRDFSKQKLTNANFANSDLTEAKFCGAELAGAIFDGADLSRADFSPAGVFGFRTFTNLEGASFNNATLTEANFKNAKMQNANFGRITLQEGTTFENADLTRADLSNVNLSRSDLWPVIFKNAILKDAKLPSNVSPEELTRSGGDEQAEPSVQGPDTVYGKDWTEQEKESTFVDGNYKGTKFKPRNNRSFYGVWFNGADLTGAKFFTGARISNASFNNANIEETDFSQLKRSDLYHTDFRSAKNKDKAIWPPASELVDAWR